MNIASSRQITGEFGGQYYTSSSGIWNGDWFKVVAISSAVVTLTTANMSPSPLALSLVQGQEIRGRFASIQVASGTVVAYNSKAGGVAWKPTTVKAGFASTDYFDWSAFGAPGNILQSGSSEYSFLGNVVTASTESGDPLFLMQQGYNWSGNFTTGDNIAYSFDNFNIIASFRNLISSIGCQIQPGALGSYTADMDCYDSGGGLVSTTSTSGVSTLNADGSAAFGGVIVSNPVIKKVVWRLTGVTPKKGKFSINRLLIS